MMSLHGTRILIAEDERHVRMLVRVILEGVGASVLEADNGEQALRLLEIHAGSVDAVVTDLNMPLMDGWELVQQLRRRWGDALPVVVCSAMTLHSRNGMLRSMTQGEISKPFAPEELVQTVGQAIARRRNAPEVIARAG